MSTDPLVLTFDPQTVDHLGARMYSHLPNAIAELVANAYDADATKVVIRIRPNGSISVEDDGHGMSRKDVADKYLRIGRNRRRELDSRSTESGRRSVSGKKGLGKLALFGIGRRIVLETTRSKSSHGVRVELSYDDMMSVNGVYRPVETSYETSLDVHGTTVTLTELKRKTPVDSVAFSRSLSRLFAYVDADFEIIVISAAGTSIQVTPALRFDSVDVEFAWSFPDDLAAQDAFLQKHRVAGRIISAEKPLPTGLRGITLYANGRMINEPEFFGSSESSYAYSYLTGSLDVDFIDNIESDVIATDRRALDWEVELTADLRSALARLLTRVGQEWRQRRSRERERKREERLGTSTAAWIRSIKPQRERESVQVLVSGISELDLTADQEGQLLEDVNRLAPHNAEYVWRHLHRDIQDATKGAYERGDYFQAVQEAIKRYVNMARVKASISDHLAQKIVTAAFGSANGKLAVFAKYGALNQFSETSVSNIEDGQKHLSMGIVSGFRNPLAHEEIRALQDSGAFTYQDCLDALSIVSHLARRLEEAQLRTR